MLCDVVCYVMWYVVWCGMLCGVVCYLVWYVMWCGILFVCMLCGVVCYLVWYHWQWWTNYSCEGDVTVSPAQDPGGSPCSLVRPQHRPPHSPPGFLLFNFNIREEGRKGEQWTEQFSTGQIPWIVSTSIRTTYLVTTPVQFNIKLRHHPNISFS